MKFQLHLSISLGRSVSRFTFKMGSADPLGGGTGSDNGSGSGSNSNIGSGSGSGSNIPTPSPPSALSSARSTTAAGTATTNTTTATTTSTTSTTTVIGSPSSHNGLHVCIPGYFQNSPLATIYANQTGNSTRDLFAACLEEINALLPITEASYLHDNAAGVGTATSLILDSILGQGEEGIILPRHGGMGTVPREGEGAGWGEGEGEGFPKILITDIVPEMVKAARDSFSVPTTWISPSPERIKIETMVADSQDLRALIPDETFTHSILNFSISVMASPRKCLGEIHRTLKLGGAAVVTTWKRFGVGEIVKAAQRVIRPDLAGMVIPGDKFSEDGRLERSLVEVGFNRDKIKVVEKRVVVGGEGLVGLREFILGEFTKPARRGWRKRDEERWEGAVDALLKEEVERYGGVLFEAWVVLAIK